MGGGGQGGGDGSGDLCLRGVLVFLCGLFCVVFYLGVYLVRQVANQD